MQLHRLRVSCHTADTTSGEREALFQIVQNQLNIREAHAEKTRVPRAPTKHKWKKAIKKSNTADKFHVNNPLNMCVKPPACCS